MTLSALIFTAGILTLAWPVSGFLLLGRTVGEKVFPENRPVWLTFFCWAYLTLAFLAWTCFFQTGVPVAYAAVGILTLSAAKFVFFYISYPQWRRAFIYLWDRRVSFVIILVCGTTLGAFMLFISRLIA